MCTSQQFINNSDFIPWMCSWVLMPGRQCWLNLFILSQFVVPAVLYKGKVTGRLLSVDVTVLVATAFGVSFHMDSETPNLTSAWYFWNLLQPLIYLVLIMNTAPQSLIPYIFHLSGSNQDNFQSWLMFDRKVSCGPRIDAANKTVSFELHNIQIPLLCQFICCWKVSSTSLLPQGWILSVPTSLVLLFHLSTKNVAATLTHWVP